jgi:hypothetical protein
VAERALDPDPASVRLDQVAGDVETEPRPAPIGRAGLPEPLEDGFLRFGAMPTPSSSTENSTPPSFRAARTTMVPPRGVNFSAFDNKLANTWRMRP